MDLKKSFSETKVGKIEWLGHGFYEEDLRQVFPEAKITVEGGEAWLVYKDKHVKSL